ncbi:MAG: Maf family protein [Bacteroidetes bacterium]|nr:Maf family protein [Bacteroidota bacterium]
MNDRKLVLASGSPRRAYLLKACGLRFDVRPTDAPEDFPSGLSPVKVPSLLSERKAKAALATLKPFEMVLTADTIVIHDGHILNKPENEIEAVAMLRKLSGQTHQVVTACCLADGQHLEIREEMSLVTFNHLNETDIVRYVKNFKPLDKAGAYGAQECLADHYNPCNEEERAFIDALSLHEIIAQSKPQQLPAEPLIAIQKISGSYFNVMGLPIHKVYPWIMEKL